MANDDELLKLKAELAFYKGFHDGVCNTGTHVIVAVSDLEKWQDSHCKAYCDHEPDEGCKPICSHECTEMRAMLKAAKEGDR